MSACARAEQWGLHEGWLAARGTHHILRHSSPEAAAASCSGFRYLPLSTVNGKLRRGRGGVVSRWGESESPQPDRAQPARRGALRAWAGAGGCTGRHARMRRPHGAQRPRRARLTQRAAGRRVPRRHRTGGPRTPRPPPQRCSGPSPPGCGARRRVSSAAAWRGARRQQRVARCWDPAAGTVARRGAARMPARAGRTRAARSRTACRRAPWRRAGSGGAAGARKMC